MPPKKKSPKGVAKKISAAAVATFYDADGTTLRSTSQWTAPGALTLVVFKESSRLGLSAAEWNQRKQKHLLSQVVFMALKLKKKNLRDDKDPAAHANIPKAMKDLGICRSPAEVQASIAANPANATQVLRLYEQKAAVEKEVQEVLIQFQAAIRQADKATGVDEKKIDAFAMSIARLCGLTVGKFKIDHRKYQLKLWGTTCGSDADVYIISSASEDLVIIFEDKAGKQATPHNNGFVGQIIGEMMMMKQHNESTKKGSSGKDVFAARIINYHAAFFKLTCTAAQMTSFSGGAQGQVPAQLPLLFCSHDATKELGFDILNADERRMAMEAFTAIRETLSV